MHDFTDSDPFYSAAQAEKLLGIPAYLVRQWAHRGLLRPAGSYWRADPTVTRPLYRFTDLAALSDRDGRRSATAA